VGKASEVTIDAPRFVWVDAHFNMSESTSLKATANFELDLTRTDKPAFRVIQRVETTLDVIRAIEFRVEYGTANSRVIEEELVALRSGIVYDIGLRTSQVHFNHDRQLFETTRSGFKLLRLPTHGCVDD
jgi:hypothetical protein